MKSSAHELEYLIGKELNTCTDKQVKEYIESVSDFKFRCRNLNGHDVICSANCWWLAMKVINKIKSI